MAFLGAPAPAHLWAAAAAMSGQSPDRLQEIKEQQQEMRRVRARLQAELKNEERRHVRLVERAARLSDDDLQAILLKRAQAKAKAEAKAFAKCKAKAKAKAKVKAKAKASGHDVMDGAGAQ